MAVGGTVGSNHPDDDYDGALPQRGSLLLLLLLVVVVTTTTICDGVQIYEERYFVQGQKQPCQLYKRIVGGKVYTAVVVLVVKSDKSRRVVR